MGGQPCSHPGETLSSDDTAFASAACISFLHKLLSSFRCVCRLGSHAFWHMCLLHRSASCMRSGNDCDACSPAAQISITPALHVVGQQAVNVADAAFVSINAQNGQASGPAVSKSG